MVHPRLAVGSHIAAELRAEIHSKLGLTGCAGIATSKLLAKLVAGVFKPNQQTTLLPESVKDIMGSLNGLRKVPGIDLRFIPNLTLSKLSKSLHEVEYSGRLSNLLLIHVALVVITSVSVVMPFSALPFFTHYGPFQE